MKYIGLLFIVAWFGLLYYALWLGSPEFRCELLNIINGLG